MYHQEVPLKIEHFHNDEDIELRIESREEIQSMLQNIADHGTRVALYYDDERNFILTTLLSVDEQGMWLDVGPSPSENAKLLRSDKIVFVSIYLHAKIQFVSHDIRSYLYKNNWAFYLELPDHLVRIQRREFYRISIPASHHAKCTLFIPPENPDDPVIERTLPIVDISGGGIGLLYGEHDDVPPPMEIFPDCQISLPGIETLTATIEVRNNVNFTSPNNVIHIRAGCRFVRMSNQMNILLQRYITRLQRESLTRP